MVEHNEWYEARYASGQAEYYKQKYYAAKRPEWEKSQKEQKQKKVALKESAALIFAEWNVEYEEINKSLWLVNFKEEKIYFYPTTNRWRVKGKKTTYYSRNAQDFLEKVYRFRNQDQYI
jgi:hypothetical protein